MPIIEKKSNKARSTVTEEQLQMMIERKLVDANGNKNGQYIIITQEAKENHVQVPLPIAAEMATVAVEIDTAEDINPLLY